MTTMKRGLFVVTLILVTFLDGMPVLFAATENAEADATDQTLSAPPTRRLF
jgi:hypothetical protein